MSRRIRTRHLVIDPLEDRQLLSASGAESIARDLLSVEVVGRSVFYNDSAFDGNDAAAGPEDDAAIATDKSALLPGGTASFVNYTSYSRGINGVMVDLAGLPSSTVTTADFEFRVGNSNDPSTWAVGPAPASILVRQGDGVAGSARVEIVWADGAIQKQWLQVTVKATPVTGLASDDVFYFGNAVAESGNSPSDAIVDAIDEQAAHNNPQPIAPITDTYDYNRDGVVDPADETIAAGNATSAAAALKLIAVPAATAAARVQRPPVAIYDWGDAGVPVYNIPAIVTTTAGTVISFAEGRTSTQDPTGYAMVARRSIDSGVTWSEPIIVYQDATHTSPINNPVPLVDAATGKLFLLFVRNQSEILVTESTTDGLSWTAPVDITSSVKVTAGNNPGPSGAYPNTAWGWYVVGPGHGIQLQSGPYAGRLIVAAYHRLAAGADGTSWANVIYSDDHGQTWHLGGGLDQTNPINNNSNESTLVELPGGNIYMSSRIQDNTVSYRGKSVSTDGGMTWSTMSLATDLPSKTVEGSLMRLNDNVLLFSSLNNSLGTFRHEMSIWLSYDNAQTWVRGRTIDFGYAGYSDMTVIGPDTVLLSYARGRSGTLIGGVPSSPVTFAEISLVRVNLRWLQSTEPYQFEWYFNERPAGLAVTQGAASIQDYGQWDQRAFPFVSSGAMQYVAGPAGDSAVRLTEGSDEIVLSQGDNTALTFDLADSFTAEIELRTTDSSGVIFGSRPTVKNWTLQLVNGRVQFSLFDGTNTPTITSTAAINDGSWHRIVAVRNATGHLLKLYIDGVAAASDVTDTTSQPRASGDPIDPVVLGAYNDTSSTSQLAADVDMVRITRAALSTADFLPADMVSPTPPPTMPDAGNAPTSLAGVQLWLPAYDPARYFAGVNYVNSLPLAPFSGIAAHSTVDGSPNRYGVSTIGPDRQVLYQSDGVIGPYWQFVASGSGSLGQPLRVNGTSGSSTANFNFVQNSGVFTLSTFVNFGAATGSPMTLFDTNEALTTLAGFSLMRNTDGTLRLVIGGGTAPTLRFNDNAPLAALVNADSWYHVAVVGTGPGNPVQFYVTPLSATSVIRYDSASTLSGPNGTYLTDSSHDLVIGGRSNTAIVDGSSLAGAAPLNGGMVNQAVFNTALTQTQIQQLFLYGKGYATVAISAVQRQPVSGPVVTFKAASPSRQAADYSATITWGDSHVSPGIVSIADGLVTITGGNTYAAAGSFPVSIAITDQVASTTVTATTTATVAPSLQANATAISAVTGRAFSGVVASFTDADPSPSSNYSATIDWGDGQQSATTIFMSNGTYNVIGAHTYAAGGNFVTSVTINDAANGDVATPGGSAAVVDPIVANAIAISTLTGDTFTGAVATFTDVDSGTTPSNYSATINWGDGNVTAGSISMAGGVFTVSGTHAYSAPANYVTSITVQDLGDGDGDVASGSASVQNAMTAAGINLVAAAGYAFSGAVATFTTPSPNNPATTFSASINWGDGNISSGTVTLAGGIYKVSGSHTYASPGTFSVATTINDAAGHTAAPVSTASVSTTAQIAARQIFYLRSPKYNVTNNSMPGYSDDNAIAPDKTAYLPGSGTSTFVNVSSYSRGINGLMVDIVGGHGTITAADFAFKAGNNNSPSLWASAAGPTSVIVRAAAGVGGSDRVELLWADNAIQKTWLEVIVKGNDALGGSNANTGLAASDVFFFGNALADSSSGDAGAFGVSSADEISARNDPHGIGNPASITNVNDFNRDGQVNSTDQVLARNNATSLGNQLKFLVAGAGGPFAPVVTANKLAAIEPSIAPAAASGDNAPINTAPLPATTDWGIATALASSQAGAPAAPLVGGRSNAAEPLGIHNRHAIDAFFLHLSEHAKITTARPTELHRAIVGDGHPEQPDDEMLDCLLAGRRDSM